MVMRYYAIPAQSSQISYAADDLSVRVKGTSCSLLRSLIPPHEPALNEAFLSFWEVAVA